MKVLGMAILCCLLIIAFNLVQAMTAANSGDHDIQYAQRIAQFAILAVPLSILYLIIWVVKLVARKR